MNMKANASHINPMFVVLEKINLVPGQMSQSIENRIENSVMEWKK